MKESIHQEFERFMRDEMNDKEREEYIKSENYKEMINLLTNTLKQFKKKVKIDVKVCCSIINIVKFNYYVERN